jgi:Tol biopolymer transport system component
MRSAEILRNRVTEDVRRGIRNGLHNAGLLVVCALLGIAGWGTATATRAAELVSVSTKGTSGNGSSTGVAVSGNGSAVAFASDATNVVTGDTNAVRDVFVRENGTTERVSLSGSGEQANGPSQATGGAPALSNDGQIVAFYSDATNLVDGDTNGQTDVFVRVRGSNSTELISQASDGTQGNGPSLNPGISADGRFVVFQSQASNLVPNDTNNASDIFVRDRVNGTTERVCDAGGEPDRFSFSPSISADGNLVAFTSAATNLVPDDTNARLDIFVCDRSTGTIERVSVSSNGAQGNGDSILPAISGDGRAVGFKSLADNLVPNDSNRVVDVFVRDRVSGSTERISVDVNGRDANDFSFPPSLSDDGRFVAFGSAATNLVRNDLNAVADVFVRDRQIGFTVFVDVTDQGQEANGGTPDIAPAISGDGMQIGFVSAASNLAPNVTNNLNQVFITGNQFFGPGSCPDGVCPGSQVCVNGFCVNPTAAPTFTKTPTPSITPTETSTPTVTPTFQVCTSDDQCPPDEHCRAGFCKKERPCTPDPGQPPTQCFPREACVEEDGSDVCECGGDCNLDGFVFVNEIGKAIKILHDLVPVDQCTAADINGDGQVMGNEITLAILNLASGCAQEPQPLTFGHDRGGMVTLTIGSATAAAGDSATVAIDLSGGKGEVATAQLDLLFDPNLLEVGDPATACVKDARLTEHVLSTSLPDAPAAPAGLQRLRLFVGDLSAPIATFADGPVATCTFRINAGVTASQVIVAADRLNVGDAVGGVFGSQAVSGGVSILLATPTPGPAPRTSCPGDCDGNGEVFVNEVTVAVRIMAGEAPLSDCPAADADGDGEVFVTDITRAVLNLGLGCPQ